MILEIDGLCKSFGGRPVLRDVGLAVGAGQIVSIIGPSGVGKTTLLEIIAGLERADAGSLSFPTQPSREHPVILVFQDFLLFPNMTVFENCAFGLRARGRSRRKIRARVKQTLDYFGLADRQANYPNQLSAGQRQRVAIARAMVVDPMLLLLDEPFANLDRNLKLSTAEFLRETQRTFGVTTLAVTHDLEEAFVMSDRVGVMLGGRLVHCGTPAEVYLRPASREAAEFLGPMNELGPALHPLVELPDTAPAPPGRLLVRPECLTLSPDPDGPGRVAEAVFAGHFIKYTVELGDSKLLAYGQFGDVEPGSRVRIGVRECLQEPEGGS